MSIIQDDEIKIGTIRRVFVGTAILFLFAAYMNLYLVVPQFSQMFTSFGVDLPGITLFVLSTYKYYIVIPLLGAAPILIVVFSSKLSKKFGIRCIRLSNLSVVAGFGGLLLVVISMYAPIFTLGQVI